MDRKLDFKLLYVDDEEKSLSYFKKIFSEDFSIVTANSAAEALEVLEEKGDDIGVLITDQRMPEKTGLELIREARRSRPNLVSLLVTAYVDLDVALEAINSGHIFQYVCKPWELDSLKIILLEAAQEVERHRYYLLLEEKNRELQIARQTQDRFIYTLSHEVRTPIGLSLSYADELLESSLSNEQREYLTSLKVVNQNLLSVLDNTLDYSMWEAGKLKLYERYFRLSDLLVKIEKSFGLQFKLANVKYALKLEVGMLDGFVGDADRLLQILINLLSNAIKYTAAGGEVTLEIRLLKEWEEKAELRFSVRNSGEGIPPSVAGRLFKPFTQLQAGKEGNGLGLLISKELVGLMGGEIGIDSAPGRGAEFWFEVKVGIASESMEEAQPKREPVEGVELPVLLAEDSAVGQALVEGILSKHGYQLDIVSNGEEAVQLAKANRYSIIILDCQMPDMNGVDATRLIRSDGLNQKTPIVGLSAMHAIMLEDRWKEAGLDEYVMKPFEGRQFLDTIHRLVAVEV